ncbi:MAG: hypothetical protein LC802_23105 [Acidobacteria bacterium]|nr:hypothetical protein [Acidobacteriota bacterium]
MALLRRDGRDASLIVLWRALFLPPLRRRRRAVRLLLALDVARTRKAVAADD